MAIKRIQLRGISRTPSDRMSEDGGVAESLNTYISEQESAPALPPEDKAEAYGLPTDLGGSAIAKTYFRAVYVHRVGTQDNFIYIQHSVLDRNGEHLIKYPGGEVIYSTPKGVTFIDKTITAIGNTLIFSTTEGNGYALFKDNAYQYLGSEIPKPQIEVYPKLYGGNANLDSSIYVYDSSRTSPSDNEETKESASLYMADSKAWDATLKTEESKRSPGYSAIMKAFWSGMQTDLLSSQYFRYPVFVRFALKLYGDSKNYIYHTVPVFLGGGAKRLFSAKLNYSEVESQAGEGTGRYYSTAIAITQGVNSYKIFSKILNPSDYEKWKDIVQSIDMFISAPVIYPEINSDMVDCDETVETTSNGGKNLYRSMSFRFQDPENSDEEKDSIKNAILEGSRLFYKVRSFSIDNLQELAEGFEQKNMKEISYLENLATRENLPDDFRSNNIYSSSKNYIINRRLLSVGLTETFGRGMEALYGIIATTYQGDVSLPKYRFIYQIKDNDGTTKYVNSRDEFQAPALNYKYVHAGLVRVDVGNTTVSTYNSDACQIIFYPDTRCTAVYVINEAGNAVKLEMKAHPHIGCAYYLGDISKKLSDLTFIQMALPEENREGSSYKYSYLFQSALETPFYYPASGRIKFSANLIAVAAISKALSEGQYGQFELYAFTDNGIWVLNSNDEGIIKQITPLPLSRDVCLSSGSLVCIDQAIVFISARGVMLLDGSRVTCISPAMTGKHYSMEQQAVDVLTRQQAGKDYGFALTDGTPFMNYMSCTEKGETQIAYDYAGSRLIFFNPAFNYEYIYMLQTNTWHKYVMDLQKGNAELKNIKILNSYPDCYMYCSDKDDKLYMFNWSTILDVLDEKTEVTSIIATRPFDLDEPDILKTINHLRIRGMFERYKTAEDGSRTPRVAYILLGSQDGKHFQRLGSLRGKSWKLFRLIILSKFIPTERISWVDIDYETRFTNKLR